MKKLLALMLTVVLGGSLLMFAGCAPKQEATEQAPAMEAPAAEEGMPTGEEAAPAAPAGGETAPAAEEAAPAAE